MTENIQDEIIVGLSDDEKNDLEKMITAFRGKQSAQPDSTTAEDVQTQILSMGENLARYADILLKFDEKIKLLHGILSLCDQKNRIMNHRIDAIIELLKRQKFLTE